MKIEQLQPQDVWRYFAALCRIPRPSEQEEAIQQYILDEAKRLKLEAERDAAGNIRVRKAASPGKEALPGVILQAHLDMVPQKNQDKEHDFGRDPITAIVRDEWVYADGTTLGADNGLGVAMILAILADKKALHPPLEALFTASEETGMTGAKGLQPQWLNGQYLINLDYEEEGELCIGCAGGTDGSFSLPYATEIQSGDIYQLKIKGLKGGHSGVDIHKRRGNALKILLRALKRLRVDALVKLQGGNLRNAIPREAEALFLSKLSPEAVQSALQNLHGELLEELCAEDAGFEMEVNFLPGVEGPTLNAADSKRLLGFLQDLPNGVVEMSADFEGLVESSSNLAAVKMESAQLEAHCLLRSSHNGKRKQLAQKMEKLAKKHGGSASFSGDYNGWQPMPESSLLQVMATTGAQIYGREVPVKMIHAGLECGILATHYPHWEMIAFGPTIESPHSPDERAHIASVERSTAWLRAALAALAERP